jgi:radical SAM family uncharacterized protein/radical SAM-linked protein
VGIEEGSVHKKPESVRLRVVLAFPDIYEVGMSYLGHKILYGLINENPEWWAERVFTPCAEAGKILKEQRALLCSLESDTPLPLFDVIGFSLTHELCYTNILYMLDLAGIPFYSADRPDGPLVVAGGGCASAAEPVAPFFDLMFLGDGEESLPEFLRLRQAALEEHKDKIWIMEEASKIPGVYVPRFFEYAGPRLPPLPIKPGYSSVTRRVVNSLDDAYYPVRQVVPFGAVHNRLTLEIARGCTRGCRFCQAGIIYRPVRERNIARLQALLDDCLSSTGYDDVSYLSLSTGDFSALKTFFKETIKRCSAEQISVSLPSLRVGSIDDDIMEGMASIRRTGATLAPEAGSQRLRDIINKGISEEEIILHAQKLFEHGWQQLKLYFMIGLPGESDADLLAIIDLCRKVRDAAGPGIKRMQVTASISPFVPKPHTPFQWEAQISLEETRRRIRLLIDASRREKRLKLRWHKPEMSFLEGVFSRGDRRLAKVVENAYAKGAIFSSWVDQFQLSPWLEAMAELRIDPGEYTRELNPAAPLPWAHLQSGIDPEYLFRERDLAFAEKTSADCRYHGCRGCGVCDTPAGTSALAKNAPARHYGNILNFPQRDQEAHKAKLDIHGRVIPRSFSAKTGEALPPALVSGLARKAEHYQVFYSKTGAAINLSQLELQSVFERAMRRGSLPLTFSQGFRPAPLLSFARALPVGVASHAEWFTLYLREDLPEELVQKVFHALPLGLKITGVRKIPLQQRPSEAMREIYLLEWSGTESRRRYFARACSSIAALPHLYWNKPGKKQDRLLDLRLHISELEENAEGSYTLSLDWSSGYLSPLALLRAALALSLNEEPGMFSAHEFLLTKLRAE